jgi:hypothetical protein
MLFAEKFKIQMTVEYVIKIKIQCVGCQEGFNLAAPCLAGFEICIVRVVASSRGSLGWSTPVCNFQKSGRIFIFLKTLIILNFYAKNLVNRLMFEVV